VRQLARPRIGRPFCEDGAQRHRIRVMQLIAETYDLMKRGLGLNDDELHDVYSSGTRVS